MMATLMMNMKVKVTLTSGGGNDIVMEGHKENDTDCKWKDITYMELPEYYTFNESKKTWKKRSYL